MPLFNICFEYISKTSMNRKQHFDYYIIYSVKCFVNNKIYVGWHATNNFNDNYLGSGKLIKAAVRKYGAANFEKQILEFCSENNWQEREIYWINKLNSIYPNGFNLTKGGDGKVGVKASLQTKNLMSKQRKGVSQLQRFINVYGEKEGKTRFEIYITNQKKSRKGKPKSEETKLKLSQSHKGKNHKKMSQETKNKISQSNKGRVFSKETIEKIRLSNLGKKRSLKTRQNISKSKIGNKNSKKKEIPVHFSRAIL